METIALILFFLLLAVIGAWDSTKCRRDLEVNHRRRRSDA